MATSDFTKDWLRNSVRGGILNVHRAVKNPTKTVLVKGKVETPVEILPGQGISIQQPARMQQFLNFANIRRIKADGAGYTIVCATEEKGLIIRHDFASDWSVPVCPLCREDGNRLAPKGRPFLGSERNTNTRERPSRGDCGQMETAV